MFAWARIAAATTALLVVGTVLALPTAPETTPVVKESYGYHGTEIVPLQESGVIAADLHDVVGAIEKAIPMIEAGADPSDALAKATSTSNLGYNVWLGGDLLEAEANLCAESTAYVPRISAITGNVGNACDSFSAFDTQWLYSVEFSGLALGATGGSMVWNHQGFAGRLLTATGSYSLSGQWNVLPWQSLDQGPGADPVDAGIWFADAGDGTGPIALGANFASHGCQLGLLSTMATDDGDGSWTATGPLGLGTAGNCDALL